MNLLPIRSFAAMVGAFLVAFLAFTVAPGVARADGEITIDRFEVKSDWPSGLKVDFVATGTSEITTVVAGVTSGRDNASVVRRPSFTPGKRVEGSFNASPGYVPPFGLITVQITFTDSEGRQVRTESKRVQYVDNRFDWSTATDGLVTAYWHGNASAAAPGILKAATRTIDQVAKQAGTRLERPITLVVYNSKTEIDSVIPFQSAATRRELVTQGQAQNEHDLVLVLADRQAEITTAHELTHLITHSATENQYLDIPFWLNEGLSVYFQGDDGVEYRSLFERAKREGKLLGIRDMTGRPGKPDQQLLMYGQGYQLVKYLIDTYGPQKFNAYLAAHKTATDIDEPMVKVYGFNRDQFEEEWRKAINAPRPASAQEPDSSVNESRRQLPEWVGPAAAITGGTVLVLSFGLVGLALFLRARSSW